MIVQEQPQTNLTTQQYEQAISLLTLFDAVVSSFHHLRVLAGDFHETLGLNAGARGVLRSIDALGPQTVPQLARSRPVSRQHIQQVVNPLIARGLLAYQPNPAHKRSKLVALTEQGRAVIHDITKREKQILGHLKLNHLTLDQLDQAAATLNQLRNLLDHRNVGRNK